MFAWEKIDSFEYKAGNNESWPSRYQSIMNAGETRGTEREKKKAREGKEETKRNETRRVNH